MRTATASAPPITTTPNLDGIGADLCAVPRWIHWRPQLNEKGKVDKIPTDPATGENIDHTASRNWRTFDDAVAALRPGLGIGIYLNGDGIIGVDRDGCVGEDGALSDDAAAGVAAFDSYAEISPSGRGVRIITRGVLPPKDRKNGLFEIYGSGRFLTITGNRVPGAPATIAEAQEAIDAFHTKYIARPESASASRQANTGPSILSDEEIISRARDAANGDKFTRLWAGSTSEYGEDDSAADLALLSILTFWTQDPHQLDRLFRRSGLNRDKWDRDDYRRRTIDRALIRTEVYEPGGTIKRSRQNGKTPHADASEKAGDARGPDPEETAGKADEQSATQSFSLADVVAVYRKWLSLPGDDEGPIYVSLGAIAANLLETDPVWLLIVGASSGGKTEFINPITGLPFVHLAATLTEASLLSGTPKREKATGSKGGLLREIGDFGILALKDFTSILAMNRDQRGQLLAALREIFDGPWTRHVGVDGGRTLSWQGKLGLLAGCTAAIDNYHGVMSVMGERFLLYRLPEIERTKQAKQALANAGQERVMRQELAHAVSGLFAGLSFDKGLPPLDEREADGLIALSSLVASARSAVERDSYKREIELILDTEAPARLVQTLRRLYAGLLTIGLDRATAWPLICKVGLDCIPKLRRSAFDILLASDDWLSTPSIAATAGYPTTTARRSLEDLAAHGVVERQSQGGNKPDLWRLSDIAKKEYAAVVPEMSDTDSHEEDLLFKNPHRSYDDFSGTQPESAEPCEESTETRVRHCWACKAVIDTSERCPACDWQICTCGACSRDCELAATLGQAS